MNAVLRAVDVGIVVIGRNEASRLPLCFGSVVPASVPFVYVDSGSADDSVPIARGFGADIVQLDPARPFSAARARNEGFSRLTGAHPGIRFVQFLDGDCTLAPAWLEGACAALEADPRRAAVVGHVAERNADSSKYNRLCALEWRSPSGDIRDFGGFGGISVVRADAFRSLDGYNAQVIAGEDSEFAVRMNLAGWSVTKLDLPMATHDANMTTFAQWWRRAVRAGHAIGQRSQLNGASAARDCVRERNSTLFWGMGLPVAVALTLVPTYGASLLMCGAYAWLVFRVWRFRTRRGDSARDAFLYARFLLFAKFANAAGLVRYAFNRLRQRYELIEYK
jgi:glycosyltransferase involved in cell wall biosynthesis